VFIGTRFRTARLHNRWIRLIVDWRQVPRALRGYRWYAADWREYARMPDAEPLCFQGTELSIFRAELSLLENTKFILCSEASMNCSKLWVGKCLTYIGTEG
jgi:hypothetical protein